jgi:hypothetical protein
MGGHRKPVLDANRAFISERLKRTPHLTLHGLKDELAMRGVTVSHNAVWLFLRREGLRFKKSCLVLSRADPTSSSGDGAGGHGREGSTLAAWSSSTRLGSRPIWRRCGVGVLRVTVCAVSRRMATGGH